MHSEADLFTLALGLTSPWQVADVNFDPEAGRIDFEITYNRGASFSCPACEAAEQGVHDNRRRSWRHLNFFQYQAYIHADTPRVRCEKCGKTSQVTPPWTRKGSGFTLLMEALVVTLCKQMPVRSVSRLLGVSDGQIWRLLDHYVDAARAQENFESVTSVGIDETASKRGQNYISLFHDLDKKRVLFACEGRGKKTVEEFTKDLVAHGGQVDKIDEVCIDMSPSYIAGVAEHLPEAEVTFDPFHVIAIVNKAVDTVRREEVKEKPVLKGTRYVWLKNEKNRTAKQQETFESLPNSKLKTARAWAIKVALQDIYATCQSMRQAEEALTKWWNWAIRCRLKPIVEAARTVRRHWLGILSWFDGGLNNGGVESINSLIQAAKVRAKGYATTKHLITITYLIAGKLTRLPAPPFITRCCG